MFFSFQRFILLVTIVSFACGAELEARAKLLASKTIVNQIMVENKDLTVLYKIYNVGSNSAYNVALKDVSFPATDFKVVKGQSSVKWSSIPPNGNVTHVLIVQPIRAGYVNFTAAQLSYDITDGGERQVCVPQRAFFNSITELHIHTALYRILCVHSLYFRCLYCVFRTLFRKDHFLAIYITGLC